MKVRVTLKDPDTMQDTVDRVVGKLPRPEGVTLEEWCDVLEDRAKETRQAITRKWMEYSEYLTVEFDTDAGTAIVIENGK